jgi:hypothetical protein
MQVGFGRRLVLAEKPDGIFDVGGEEDIFLEFDFVGRRQRRNSVLAKGWKGGTGTEGRSKDDDGTSSALDLSNRKLGAESVVIRGQIF